MLPSIEQRIASELQARPQQVAAAASLLDAGASVPFIARYRKEATGGLDDTQLRLLQERLHYLRELEQRREAVLASIAEQGRLTAELRAQIESADSKQRLEDLYLPYRPKRRTKAQLAREAGLEPLAESLLADPALIPERAAEPFLRPAFLGAHGDNPGAPDVKAALEGARQILMERFAEDAELIGRLRDHLSDNALLVATVAEGKAEAGANFRDYFGYVEAIREIPSHRALALFRGRNEDILRVSMKLPEEMEEPSATPAPCSAERMIAARYGIAAAGRPADAWLRDTVRWAWRVKIGLTLETELFAALRERAEAEAIRVFARNLHDLLLAAPAGPRTVIGLDPGLRTGVKVAVVDRTGKLLETATIYPHAPRNDWDGAIAQLSTLAAKHAAELISIGNGTASRETDRLVADLVRRHPALKLTRVLVSEAGASVYSASDLAAREFPALDVSLRGAVSIARRLQDPLAELVKIDPKSIGVGQYQHDVSQSRLAHTLDGVVEDCVNAVGVDVNTASVPLLSRISGLSAALADSIVRYRDEHGPFADRETLKRVPRLGPKTFEQAAGFLRVIGGSNPLDGSAVHPEAYPVVERVLAYLERGIRDVIGKRDVLAALDPQRFIDAQFGLPTVQDILGELEKPGRDPRPAFRTAAFKDGVERLEDLQPGMLLEGVVTNVTNFGAFVDVGVHQDGLVHVSVLANRFVRDPREVVKAGDVVRVKVIEVDRQRRRIALSMRLQEPETAARQPRPDARPRTRTGKPVASSPKPARKPAPGRHAEPAATGAMAQALQRALKRA